jgi:hypothetical protein
MRFFAVLAMCAALTFPSFAQEAPPAPAEAAPPSQTPGPVKCLMMGLGPHGEAFMGETLEYIEANYPSVAITATEDLEALRYDNLKNYDVLCVVQLKVEGGNPPDFVKEAIVQFLKDGGGLVVTHFAVANVQEWADSIDIYGAMWVSGKSTHDPYHTFRVDIADEGHPSSRACVPSSPTTSCTSTCSCGRTCTSYLRRIRSASATRSRSPCSPRTTSTTPAACTSPWATTPSRSRRRSTGRSSCSPSNGPRGGGEKQGLSPFLRRARFAPARFTRARNTHCAVKAARGNGSCPQFPRWAVIERKQLPFTALRPVGTA